MGDLGGVAAVGEEEQQRHQEQQQSRNVQEMAPCVDILEAARDPTSSMAARTILILGLRLLAIQAVFQFFQDASTSHFFLRASQIMWCWQSTRPFLHAFLLGFSNMIVLLAHVIPTPVFVPLVLNFTFPVPFSSERDWSPSVFLLVLSDILVFALQFFILSLRVAIRPEIPPDSFPPLSETLVSGEGREMQQQQQGMRRVLLQLGPHNNLELGRPRNRGSSQV